MQSATYPMVGGAAGTRRSIRRLPPHVALFLLYNAAYLLPLVAVFVWGYSEGGAGETARVDISTMGLICGVYVLGSVAFTCGAGSFTALQHMRLGTQRPWAAPLYTLTLADRLALVGLVGLFVLTKVALVPLGVYQRYAFDTGEMSGGVWSFSMFCSEAMILAAVLVLFSSSKWNVRGFLLLSAINGVNLLHGSRVFFVITVMAAVLYAYVRGHLTLRRVFIYGPLALLALLTLGYFVFLSRTGASLEGAFSAAQLASPLVYESVFSQQSLMTLIGSPDTWDRWGHFGQFLQDIVLNTSPRLLVPEKDELVYFNEYAYLTPLGGFNGYGAGLIYFGLFFPVMYFALGAIGSWLQAKARDSSWWLVLYGYFCASTLFRIMRDGYLIPIKMLINAVQILLILTLLRALFRGVSATMQADSAAHTR